MTVHATRALRLDPAASAFAQDVLNGLAQPQKTLPSKYFYDDAGSELFEEITRLPEYYPTRTELSILRERAAEIVDGLPSNAALIEFGAGATTKARILLDAAKERIAAYVPVDISGGFIAAQAAQLAGDYPTLAVFPVAADFTAPFALPQQIAALPKAGFFPGSTLGNFEPAEAQGLLRSMSAILGRDAFLIIGVDLDKSATILEPAYDDAAGVTARFNLNLLTRVNRELGGDFNLRGFSHRALYNAAAHRIEMHLVSTVAQTVHLLGRAIVFRAGETIHTENSYKYSVESFSALADGAGWRIEHTFVDAQTLFSVHVLRTAG